jgi:hypothetical protein
MNLALVGRLNGREMARERRFWQVCGTEPAQERLPSGALRPRTRETTRRTSPMMSHKNHVHLSIAHRNSGSSGNSRRGAKRKAPNRQRPAQGSQSNGARGEKTQNPACRERPRAFASSVCPSKDSPWVRSGRTTGRRTRNPRVLFPSGVYGVSDLTGWSIRLKSNSRPTVALPFGSMPARCRKVE